MSNVTPIKPPPARHRTPPDYDTVKTALGQAQGILDLLQGATAEGIDFPSSSLCRTLAVISDLLDKVKDAVWPSDDADEEVPS